MSPRILIVDDEPALARSLGYALERARYEIAVRADGPSAVATALSESFDLIILDLMLPGLSGMEACRRIRSKNTVPIIMLTARDSERDLITGLDIGADDYVTKPFSIAELVGRIRALIRRRALDQTAPEPHRREVGDLAIDLLRHEVTKDGAAIALTPSEYKILALLSTNPGSTYTRRQIMEHLWNSSHVDHSHSCEVHISSLRRKIEEDARNPTHLRTTRGIGYRLDRPSLRSGRGAPPPRGD